MSYLMLYGVGWTQRWRIKDETADLVRAEIDRLGRTETSHVPVLDPGSNEVTALVVAWQHVAAAVVIGSDHEGQDVSPTGQYA